MEIVYYTINSCRRILKKIKIPFSITILLVIFTITSVQSQRLYDAKVELNRVEWGGDCWCSDGAVDIQLPPLPPICIDLGNDPDIRYRYRIGYDGDNFKSYLHLGAELPITPFLIEDAIVLDEVSDTDGRNINNDAYTVNFKKIAGNSLTFDLDAWEEDVALEIGIPVPPCPIDADIVYNNDYSLICGLNPFDDSDDARSTAIRNFDLTQNDGSTSYTTDFGNYSMDWTVTSFLTPAPDLAYGELSVCSGNTTRLIASSSSNYNNDIMWFTDLNDPIGSTLEIGVNFTTPTINSFPATYYYAIVKNGAYGDIATATITENTSADCEICRTPEYQYVYNTSWFNTDLGWTPVVGADRYQAEGRLRGGLGLVTRRRTVTDHEFTTRTLFPFLTYEFRVRADCEGVWTEWSDYTAFTLNPASCCGPLNRVPENFIPRDYLEELDIFDTDRVFVTQQLPSTNSIHFGYYGEELGEGRIEIRDMTGRIIHRDVMDLYPFTIKQVDDAINSSGIYLISLYKDDILLETEKIVFQH